MTARDTKQPPAPETRQLHEEEVEEEAAQEAAGEVLTPAMPPAGAGMMLDVDPRLNRPSETEDELKRVVESVEDAEEDDKDADKD